MSGPSRPGLRLHLREAHPGGRIGDADENLTAGALNLTPCELRLALQGLVAVGAVEFEFVCVHKSQPIHAQTRGKKYIEKFYILFLVRLRM